MNEHKITWKMFISTMMVLVIAELSGAFTCVIDGLITSRYLGNLCMSAFGVSNVYFSVISVVNGILMIGCQTISVGLISKNDKLGARKVMTSSAILGVTLTFIMMMIIHLFPEFVCVLFGATKGDTEMIREMTLYLRGVSIGAPFWCLMVLLTPLVQLDGGGNVATIASLASAVVDIILDILLGVALNMGSLGMGLATAASHIASCLVVLAFVFSKRSTMKFCFEGLSLKKMPKVLYEGLPRAFTMIARTIAPIILNIIVIRIVLNNTIGINSLSIQRSISYFACSIGWGIGGSLLMISTIYYNDHNLTELKAVIKDAIFSIVAFIGIFGAIIYFASPLIVKLFLPTWNVETELFELATYAIKTFALSLPFVAFNLSFASYVQAIGKNLLSIITCVNIECTSLVIACYLLSLNNGYKGFFLGFFIGELALTIVCIGYWFICKLINSKNKFSTYMLKNDFLNEGDIILEKNLLTIDDIVEFSERTINECKDSYLTTSQVNKLGLCIEEMATNVFLHGFNKDNKKHSVMIRVVVTNNSAVVTLTDDCKEFDITKKLKTIEVDPEHPEKNLGIRMIMLLAKKINYTNTLKINNLQIII